MELYHTIGEIKGSFTRDELIKLCNENDLLVSVLTSNYFSESLDYYDIEKYLSKFYKPNKLIRLVKQENQKFYCKSYNS
jgi:hypothetical protein